MEQRRRMTRKIMVWSEQADNILERMKKTEIHVEIKIKGSKLVYRNRYICTYTINSFVCVCFVVYLQIYLFDTRKPTK